MKLRALRGTVLVDDIKRGDRLIGKIIIPNDDGKTSGIRPRWGRVHAVGSDITVIKPGDWVLLKHGAWTRSMEVIDDNGEELTIWAVDWPNGALLVSDEPEGVTFTKELSHAHFKRPQ